MNDEKLVRLLRLGEWGGAGDEEMVIAADRIEALESKLDQAEARVRELESVFSHLYGQAVWLRGDQAYRGFARAFINRMSALRIKCVSRQELAKIEEKQND